MKKVLLLATMFLAVISVRAQNQDATVEQQYPGDAKAKEVYEVAVAKQASPKTSALRTTWIANKPSSNWFISARIGGGGVLSEGAAKANFWEPWDWFNEKTGFWHPTVGASLGKWFTPVWGARLDGTIYGGVQSFGKSGNFLTGARYWAATADYLVNLKNFFLPYNPKGFFNPVVYAGLGVVHTNEENSQPAYYNVAVKGGLQLNFRLNDAFDLFLDGHALLVPKNFDRNSDATVINSDVVTNATLGLTYRFNFRHFIKAPLADQSVIDALNTEINELRNLPQPICPPVKNCPEPQIIKETAVVNSVELTPVFFKINSSIILDEQLISIARAAQYLMDTPDAKIEIQAYSDKKTGSAKGNLKLSESRAKAVEKVLTGKFGINKNRVKTSFYGDTVQPFSENDKNRVVIFVK